MTLLPLTFLLIVPTQFAGAQSTALQFVSAQSTAIQSTAIQSTAIQSDRERCESIRSTRELAAQDGLPISPTLVVLEQRYCSAPPVTGEPQSASTEQDADPCFDLWFTTELAFTAGEVDMGYAVDELRAAVCAAGSATSATRYANGVRVLTDAGTVRYPNSAVARNGVGVWRYPDGTRALGLDGVWSYPNGVRARSTRGAWSDPRGRAYKSVTDMLLSLCRDQRDVCQPALDGMTGWEGDARILGLIRVAWDAYVADKRRAAKRGG